MPSLTSWLAAITLALVIGCSHYLDDIPDHSAETQQALDIEDALKAADARQRFERAAQRACGPQSAWAELADGSIQCRTKHGRKTMVAQGVTP